jgi:AcrR family transcriptional regulator
MAGLRARKRAQTRDEIIDAALTLFEQKGFDGATIDDVAAAADVSPRTVFRYFATKEDLVFFGQDEENRRILAMLRSVPRGNDAIGAIMRVTRTILLESSPSSEQLMRSQRLVHATPSLRVYEGKMRREIERIVAGALVPARPTRAETLRGRMMAAVYVAALDAAMSSWMEAGARGTPVRELDEVDAVVRRAFPARKTGPRRKSP